jgi:hypothetical protein
MEEIKVNKGGNLNVVENNKNEAVMNKKLNLLFIEGNRQNIDKENVRACYNKIKNLGYIESMPIEYIPMDEAIKKIGNRKLFKMSVERNVGKGDATISNFKITLEVIKQEDYPNYDGVCEDGQHRDLALQFPALNEVQPTYTEVHIPENMDIVSYIALRNNGKVWNNGDFYNSGISTNDKEMDYILSLCKKYKAAFIFALYTFGTINLTSKQIKSIQLGYKKTSDYGKLQLSKSTRETGDKILNALREHKFLSEDRFNGRFAQGLKQYYNEVGNDEQKVIDTINLIDKEQWDKHFTPKQGLSMEAKSYVEAFKALYADFEG